MKKQNYLNNRDLLTEIHKSKNNFSSFTKPEYADYDAIVHDISEINQDTIIAAKKSKAKSLKQRNLEQARQKYPKAKASDFDVDYQTIDKQDLVFRVMTYDHIPDDPSRKKNPKSDSDFKIKLNFPPFQHFKYNENDELVCVGKSHWIGDMEHGYFSSDHAQATEKLALMWMRLCDRYSTKANFRGYTYNDEMKGQAILQLAQIGLQFDESKSDNPFSYYTAVVTNSFVRVINVEKKNQSIRDDILEMNNLNPSYTRQHNEEWQSSLRNQIINDA